MEKYVFSNFIVIRQSSFKTHQDKVYSNLETYDSLLWNLESPLTFVTHLLSGDSADPDM